MRGVQLKLWDPLRTRAIPESLRGVFTTRRYTNPRSPYLTLPLPDDVSREQSCNFGNGTVTVVIRSYLC